MSATVKEIVAGVLLFAMMLTVVVALGNMAADRCDLLAAQQETRLAEVR